MRYDLIYTVDGANLMRDPAATIPQIGWTFSYLGQDWKVIDVYQDYTNWPREKYEIKVQLLNELPKEKERPHVSQLQKSVKCIQVWSQSAKHLTAGTEYEILYTRGKGERAKFYIIDDKGKKRGFYFNNTQFNYTE